MRIFAMLISLIIAFAGCSQNKTSGTKWESSFEVALQKADKEGKNILLIISKDTCPWCQKLKNETLKDKEVLELIGSKFIPILLESPKDSKELAKLSYETKGVPATLLLDTKGREFGRITGFVDSKNFQNELIRLTE